MATINNGNINRDKVHSLVEVFYQPSFKTFYVNSVDGETFVKPVGVFVSLGITTSLKVLEDIKNIISGSEGYSATLAEIKSKKVAGQFLNTVTCTTGPKQYKITNLSEDIMGEEESKAELERMKNLMNPSQDLDILKEYAPKISRLQDLIDKLTSTHGWDAHLIQKETSGDYRIFHQYINYKKEGELEYRVGIFVTEDVGND
jgi:hypothetical protein